MSDTFPEVEPDMTPPTGRTVREMLGREEKPPPGKQPPKSRAKSSSVDWDDIESQLVITYKFVGSIAQMVGPQTGQAIDGVAESAARSWIKAAEQNDRIAKFLTSGSGLAIYMMLITAHMPILITAYNEFFVAPRMAMQDAEPGGEPSNPNGTRIVDEDLPHRVEVIG